MSDATCVCSIRPATGDSPLDSSLMIGVPAGSFSCPGQGLSYYFVALKSGNAPVANQRPLPFEGLKMGQQLGRGARLLACTGETQSCSCRGCWTLYVRLACIPSVCLPCAWACKGQLAALCTAVDSDHFIIAPFAIACVQKQPGGSNLLCTLQPAKGASISASTSQDCSDAWYSVHLRVCLTRSARADVARGWPCRLVWARVPGHIPGTQDCCEGGDLHHLSSCWVVAFFFVGMYPPAWLSSSQPKVVASHL